jgi:hypothetical protein
LVESGVKRLLPAARIDVKDALSKISHASRKKRRLDDLRNVVIHGVKQSRCAVSVPICTGFSLKPTNTSIIEMALLFRSANPMMPNVA